MGGLSTGLQLCVGVCLVVAAGLTWQHTAALFDTLVCAGLALPFLGGAVRNLVRWNRRTRRVTGKDGKNTP